jgi:hypothetical protein
VRFFGDPSLFMSLERGTIGGIMRSPVLAIYLLSSVAILGIAHAAALNFSLYWQFPWFDIPMHILGGIVVALSLLLLASFINSIPERYVSFRWVLIGVLIIGLLWELFEIAIGIPLIEHDFEADMFLDLAMDLCGGAIGYVLGKDARVL